MRVLKIKRRDYVSYLKGNMMFRDWSDHCKKHSTYNINSLGEQKMSNEEIDLEKSVKLLTLPRNVGIFPETKKEIVASIGPYGPYLKHEKRFVSLKEDDVTEMNKDIYKLDFSEEQMVTDRIESEVYNISHLPEDDDDGENDAIDYS